MKSSHETVLVDAATSSLSADGHNCNLYLFLLIPILTFLNAKEKVCGSHLPPFCLEVVVFMSLLFSGGVTVFGSRPCIHCQTCKSNTEIISLIKCTVALLGFG